eukprot:3104119-Rhodomonas_salina.3
MASCVQQASHHGAAAFSQTIGGCWKTLHVRPWPLSARARVVLPARAAGKTLPKCCRASIFADDGEQWQNLAVSTIASIQSFPGCIRRSSSADVQSRSCHVLNYPSQRPDSVSGRGDSVPRHLVPCIHKEIQSKVPGSRH